LLSLYGSSEVTDLPVDIKEDMSAVIASG
jgi:hypothetical protein